MCSSLPRFASSTSLSLCLSPSLSHYVYENGKRFQAIPLRFFMEVELELQTEALGLKFLYLFLISYISCSGFWVSCLAEENINSEREWIDRGTISSMIGRTSLLTGAICR